MNLQIDKNTMGGGYTNIFPKKLRQSTNNEENNMSRTMINHVLNGRDVFKRIQIECAPLMAGKIVKSVLFE